MNLKERNSISFLRVFAMTLILLCHIVQEYNNIYIQMTAQFLNVGVTIFIIISGYLYGSKNINKGYVQWIVKRLKRILIPLYIFMVYLLLIYLVKGININIIKWIAYMFNLQGFEIYVHGAEHLWYLTIIMVCYLITPILNKYKNNSNNKNIVVFIGGLVVLQILISYFLNTQIGIYLIYIIVYIIVYIIGHKWNKKLTRKMLLTSIIVAIVACVSRILGRIVFDNTIVYNVIIVGYTQALLAFSIFYIFIHFGKLITSNKYIRYIDSISFDIYLVHYMYMVGPLRIMGITNNFIINTIITLVISLITAILLNNICKYIYMLLERNKVKEVNEII